MLNRITGEARPGTEIPMTGHQEGLTQEAVFEGKQIVLEQSASSLIADAAEELTFSTSETVEKKIEERRAEKERPSGMLARIKQLQSLLPDFPQNKMRRWMQSLRTIPPQNARDLLASLHKEFDDVSHQHGALSLLEEFADNPALRSLAQEAKAALESESGPSLRAGYNVSATAETYAAQGLGTTQELRTFYRETILHYEGVSQTFHDIIERFPSQSIPQAVSYLIRAVGMDLHARGPSIGTEELQIITNDLYHLEALANLHRSAEQLLQRTQRGFGALLHTDPQQLLGEFLALKDKNWVTDSDVIIMVQRLSIDDSSARVYFLQGFLDMTRQAPLKLFPSDESRLALISKIQEALDRFIEEE